MVPERGFEYFPSPESSEDDERIAFLFLQCSIVVEEWPRFRLELEEAGAMTPKQCGDLEKNAISVFREVRDAMITAAETGESATMPQSRLLDRMVHAHGTLALYADTPSLVEYRREICPQIDTLPWWRRPDQGDFNKALWEGTWNAPGDQMPAEVTGEETIRNWWAHETDGLRSTRGRRDPVAKADTLEPMFPATEPVSPLFPIGEPRFRPPDERVLRTSSTIELAIRREEARKQERPQQTYRVPKWNCASHYPSSAALR
jgi:hypothetical protein